MWLNVHSKTIQTLLKSFTNQSVRLQTNANLSQDLQNTKSFAYSAKKSNAKTCNQAVTGFKG